jgi:hypothetical protein
MSAEVALASFSRTLGLNNYPGVLLQVRLYPVSTEHAKRLRSATMISDRRSIHFLEKFFEHQPLFIETMDAD